MGGGLAQHLVVLFDYPLQLLRTYLQGLTILGEPRFNTPGH